MEWKHRELTNNTFVCYLEDSNLNLHAKYQCEVIRAVRFSTAATYANSHLAKWLFMLCDRQGQLYDGAGIVLALDGKLAAAAVASHWAQLTYS